MNYMKIKHLIWIASKLRLDVLNRPVPHKQVRARYLHFRLNNKQCPKRREEEKNIYQRAQKVWFISESCEPINLICSSYFGGALHNMTLKKHANNQIFRQSLCLLAAKKKTTDHYSKPILRHVLEIQRNWINCNNVGDSGVFIT